jgi:hypothetical protein
LNKALNRALGGGVSGAAAMFINVGSLMWLRTTVNYQYRYGTTTTEAFKKLYKDGGIPRFYKGVGPALIQGPLSRFGDTAANVGVLALLDSYDTTRNLSPFLKTGLASVTAASWRIFLMPVDTLKTTMQVEGSDGIKKLKTKLNTVGPRALYHGGLAAASATAVGHYPWFATYNALQAYIPQPEKDQTLQKFGRNAFIGFCSSAISDTTSNSIRVIKVYKQSSTESLSYVECAKRVIESDGVMGLFGRGLRTKLLANGMQGVMFSCLWRYFDDMLKEGK